MNLPKVHGVIGRRLLVNFRVDPEIIQRQLPAPFRPKLHDGCAVAGICLIRLQDIRPKRFPRMLGLSSENAAHRIAVVWDDAKGSHEGVYIPRRDTGSLMNHLAARVGGRRADVHLSSCELGERASAVLIGAILGRHRGSAWPGCQDRCTDAPTTVE